MSRGRPREFDTEAVLEQAVAVFAREGFEQASVQELADAMGICKPSLYAAFGNKEALFLEVLRRYADRVEARRAAVLHAEADGARAVHAMLQDAVASFTHCTEAAGCLLVARAASAPPGAHDPAQELIGAVMERDRALLESRIAQAQRDGQLAADVDAGALTTYFCAVLAGLSVLARAGVQASALRASVDTAMQAWRTPVPTPDPTC